MPTRRVVALMPLIAALGLAGCSTPASGADSADSAGAVRVWASTSVWGSIAEAVGGRFVTVTSAVDKPGQDPHDYEPTARDKLEVRRARLAIYNGGGYDDWARKLVASERHTKAVDAAELSGLDVETNEHVFWSLPTAEKVADVVAADLAAADPAHRADFLDGAARFKRAVQAQLSRARTVGPSAATPTVVMSEPVVGYLVAEMGLRDLTPTTFRTQSESGSVSVAALSAARTVIGSGRDGLFVLNAQTQDSVSARLETTAKEHHVPVVKVYETFPAGTSDYVSWVRSCIDSFAAAVRR